MVAVTHHHDTLDKVVFGLKSAGIPDMLIIDSINAMQNQGILFRERAEPAGKGSEEDLAEGQPVSNLVMHARRELMLLGEDDDVISWYCRTIEAFASYSHSGGSYAATVPVLLELLQFKNLTPLTNDADEWVKHGPDTWPPDGIWQSARRPDAFSEDGGKMYYLLDEVEDGKKKYYTSADKAD